MVIRAGFKEEVGDVVEAGIGEEVAERDLKPGVVDPVTAQTPVCSMT